MHEKVYIDTKKQKKSEDICGSREIVGVSVLIKIPRTTKAGPEWLYTLSRCMCSDALGCFRFVSPGGFQWQRSCFAEGDQLWRRPCPPDLLLQGEGVEESRGSQLALNSDGGREVKSLYTV